MIELIIKEIKELNIFLMTKLYNNLIRPSRLQEHL